jgi:hypothetical protein
MKTQKTASTKKSSCWTKASECLGGLSKPDLLALVKDLYDLTPANRAFINARCQSEGDDGETLEAYRDKIVEQFFPKRGEGKLKLGEARKAISDYRKATGNVAGVAELLMTYVENGVRFTCEYGDIDERFYNSIESALKELSTLLRKKARKLYPVFCKRLEKIEQQTEGIGWGFHDAIGDVVGELKEDLGCA